MMPERRRRVLGIATMIVGLGISIALGIYTYYVIGGTVGSVVSFFVAGAGSWVTGLVALMRYGDRDKW